jgi:hypothetical protein
MITSKDMREIWKVMLVHNFVDQKMIELMI